MQNIPQNLQSLQQLVQNVESNYDSKQGNLAMAYLMEEIFKIISVQGDSINKIKAKFEKEISEIQENYQNQIIIKQLPSAENIQNSNQQKFLTQQQQNDLFKLFPESSNFQSPELSECNLENNLYDLQENHESISDMVGGIFNQIKNSLQIQQFANNSQVENDKYLLKQDFLKIMEQYFIHFNLNEESNKKNSQNASKQNSQNASKQNSPPSYNNQLQQQNNQSSSEKSQISNQKTTRENTEIPQFDEGNYNEQQKEIYSDLIKQINQIKQNQLENNQEISQKFQNQALLSSQFEQLQKEIQQISQKQNEIENLNFKKQVLEHINNVEKKFQIFEEQFSKQAINFESLEIKFNKSLQEQDSEIHLKIIKINNESSSCLLQLKETFDEKINIHQQATENSNQQIQLFEKKIIQLEQDCISNSEQLQLTKNLQQQINTFTEQILQQEKKQIQKTNLLEQNINSNIQEVSLKYDNTFQDLETFQRQTFENLQKQLEQNIKNLKSQENDNNNNLNQGVQHQQQQALDDKFQSLLVIINQEKQKLQEIKDKNQDFEYFKKNIFEEFKVKNELNLQQLEGKINKIENSFIQIEELIKKTEQNNFQNLVQQKETLEKIEIQQQELQQEKLSVKKLIEQILQMEQAIISKQLESQEYRDNSIQNLNLKHNVSQENQQQNLLQETQLLLQQNYQETKNELNILSKHIVQIVGDLEKLNETISNIQNQQQELQQEKLTPDIIQKIIEQTLQQDQVLVLKKYQSQEFQDLLSSQSLALNESQENKVQETQLLLQQNSLNLNSKQPSQQEEQKIEKKIRSNSSLSNEDLQSPQQNQKKSYPSCKNQDKQKQVQEKSDSKQQIQDNKQINLKKKTSKKK